MKKLSLLFCLFILGGCAVKVPKEALQLPPESLANRQLQTRIFETGDEKAVLVAANAVLQDLGFNLDETSTELGVVVASKRRDATDFGQVFMLALLGGLANNPSAVDSADAVQLIKASLVVRGLEKKDERDVNVELSSERIREVRDKIYSVMYEVMLDEFPKNTCDKIAKNIAERTADTLEHDFDTLLAIKDTRGKTAVRVTFQRVIYNKNGAINTQEQINDVSIYREFFEKLSKSLFLEANQI